MQLTSLTVALDDCPDYTRTTLFSVMDRLVFKSDPSLCLRSLRVLLKPNLISARRGPLACTEAEFILAAAQWFCDQGAVVSIGDSPVFGTAKSVLAALGIDERLNYLGVPILSFRKKRTIPLESGVTALLAAEAFDCDLLVNLPRVKAHDQLRLTMAVKNFFGCLVGMQKPWWHMRHGGHGSRFESLLVEILRVLPDSLTIIDGIVAMHERGPLTGSPFPLKIMAAAANPVALDTALLTLLGIDSNLSPLWQACRNSGIPGTDIEELDFVLRHPRDLPKSGFIVPEKLQPIRFRPLQFFVSSLKRFLLGFR